ncbi:unnamed protein product [Adineta steineri]|uniref:Cadherin-like beta sandwich domain-containing protein n=1 Tax=Adineta steineri TaxID=433720 RepID=A0A813T5R1_9BILA|nr:unnamed protein product [Adineta steineri]CAF3689166.1 unnamed protein product [Adineta steineri]
MFKLYSFVFLLTVLNAEQFQPNWELNYLFPSMVFEPAFKLTPPYKHAFYLFAAQSSSETGGIIIKQDGNIFQTLTIKQYWQSNKIPISLDMEETTIELYIQDGDKVGPTYTIHVKRQSS